MVNIVISHELDQLKDVQAWVKKENDMNLTELQVELRNVENRMSQLSVEIEKMKPKKQESKIDYDTITSVARKYPINELDICHAPEQLCKEFVSMLMYLFVADDNGLSERLLYLTRLAAGCKLQMNAKDMYQSALAIEMDDVERLSAELVDYRYSFVIEAFIVANLSVEIDKNTWILLADIAQLMKCDEEEIVVLSHVAKYKLTGDTRHLEEIPLPKTNRWSGKLREYIPEVWIQSKRRFCIQVVIQLEEGIRMEEGKSKIEKKEENGLLVHCGDSILVYKELVKKKHYSLAITPWRDDLQKEDKWETHVVEAACEGMLLFDEYTVLSPKDGMWYSDASSIPKDTYLEAYIVSPFDDYDSFKSWMDNR